MLATRIVRVLGKDKIKLVFVLAFFFSTSSFSARTIGNFKELPDRAMGLFVTAYTRCGAFLSGNRQITTAAHCIKHGLKDAKFYLHYQNGNYTAVSSIVTPVFLTGGGQIDPEQKYYGRDWAHLLLEEPLGKKIIEGQSIGYLPLWSGDIDTEKDILTLSSYPSDFHDGKYLTNETCQFSDYPEELKKYCKTSPDGNFSCSFFTFSCKLSEKGGESGSPLTIFRDGKPKVVGIVSGALTTPDGKTTFSVANTVNDSEEPSSNVYLHWLSLHSYANFYDAAKIMAQFKIPYVVDKNITSLSVNVERLLNQWHFLTVRERFSKILEYNSIESQKIVYELSDSFYLALIDWARGPRQSKFVEIDSSKKEVVIQKKPGKKYGMHYYQGLVISDFVEATQESNVAQGVTVKNDVATSYDAALVRVYHKVLTKREADFNSSFVREVQLEISKIVNSSLPYAKLPPQTRLSKQTVSDDIRFVRESMIEMTVLESLAKKGLYTDYARKRAIYIQPYLEEVRVRTQRALYLR